MVEGEERLRGVVLVRGRGVSRGRGGCGGGSFARLVGFVGDQADRESNWTDWC